MCFDAVYSACSGALYENLQAKNSPRILDAGCGTGVSTDYLAFLNPDSEILAIDISEQALSIASERLRRSGAFAISNITFEKVSILEIGERKPFDFINSIGMLHHLQEPCIGLAALAKLLKPGGIIHLLLYAEGGRVEINRIKKVLKIIGLQGNDDGVSLGKSLLRDLPENNRLRKHYFDMLASLCDDDKSFADIYLHPFEINFNISSLFELIDKSGLEFAGFTNPNVWELQRFLQGELLLRGRSLPLIQQLQLIEDLDPDLDHFEFFLAKPPLPKFEWSEDSEMLRTCGRISPCVSGWPGQDLLDQEMNPLTLDSKAYKFLKILQDCPQETQLVDLPLDFSSEEMASIARDLHRRNVLLLSPCRNPAT